MGENEDQSTKWKKNDHLKVKKGRTEGKKEGRTGQHEKKEERKERVDELNASSSKSHWER